MQNAAGLKLNLLSTLSLRFGIRSARRWYYRRAEEQYLICAAVEHARAREAEENEAYYQKRAAMARAALRMD
ncbi:MAG: hypothetical protein RL369_715 [Pseudomonadota bacterium]